MSKYKEVEIECPDCKEKQTTTVWQSLNTRLNPEAKKLLLARKINIFHCQKCAKDFLLPVPLLYHDQEKAMAVYYYPPEWINDENFISQFEIEKDGQVINKSENDLWSAMPDAFREISNYLMVPHIVFNFDNLLSYITFRDKIFEKKIGDSKPELGTKERIEENKPPKTEVSKGGISEGLANQCYNEQSGATYFVSTIYQQADACWTTVVFPSVERKSWFGVTKQYEPDPSKMLRTYIRNNQKEAYEVHKLVAQMVANEPEEVWDSVGPDPMPPDGFNEITQRAFEERWGKTLSPEIRARFRSMTDEQKDRNLFRNLKKVFSQWIEQSKSTEDLSEWACIMSTLTVAMKILTVPDERRAEEIEEMSSAFSKTISGLITGAEGPLSGTTLTRFVNSLMENEL